MECFTDAPIRECLGIHCLKTLGPGALLACQLSTVSVYAQLHIHRVNVIGNSFDPLWKCGGVRNQPLGCWIPAHSPAVVLGDWKNRRVQSGFWSGQELEMPFWMVDWELARKARPLTMLRYS